MVSGMGELARDIVLIDAVEVVSTELTPMTIVADENTALPWMNLYVRGNQICH